MNSVPKYERVWVDMAPDDDLPVRILGAYLDNSYWSSTCGEVTESASVEENPLIVAMNQHRERRNAILHRAIEKLRREL